MGHYRIKINSSIRFFINDFSQFHTLCVQNKKSETKSYSFCLRFHFINSSVLINKEQMKSTTPLLISNQCVFSISWDFSGIRINGINPSCSQIILFPSASLNWISNSIAYINSLISTNIQCIPYGTCSWSRSCNLDPINISSCCSSKRCWSIRSDWSTFAASFKLSETLL